MVLVNREAAPPSSTYHEGLRSFSQAAGCELRGVRRRRRRERGRRGGAAAGGAPVESGGGRTCEARGLDRAIYGR